ncbi:MAG: 2-C-methyl-D-erythritol 2,4-cyclodiphosphate synthase [Planctomycetota bacterium]|nr:MAG: 2-C-methyl-D-erythritol 2,4-cyclodiphosphate synthase [Planctomycetota bacterium]
MSTTPYRVGLGHDTHRLEAGRRLVIGGVEIPHEKGFVAHSDGDVLLHAITDAVLGAAGLGDIGEWFPDTDPQYHGTDSRVLLKAAVQAARTRGWSVVNVDCTVFAQRPKLSPCKQAMVQAIAQTIGIDSSCVNVKAKTGERVGPVGHEESMDASAIVMLWSGV